MKEELMYDGITEIREDIIERAETYVFPGEAENAEGPKELPKKARKVHPVWVTIAVAAACLVLVVASPFVYIATRRAGSEAPAANPGQSLHGNKRPGDAETGKENPGDKAPETSVASADVWIYFVQDGEICKERYRMNLQAEVVFDRWRAENGIGEEVQLLECEIRSKAITEQQGEADSHTSEYNFFMYLTVSQNLESYYEQKDEVLLLDSLRQTMTGYSGMTFQEYHLILE